MSWVIDEVKMLQENKSQVKEGSADILNNPAYREKYKERFNEARKKFMDMVQFYDGTIVLIENKIAMYYYAWHNKKMDFERKKQQTISKDDVSM